MTDSASSSRLDPGELPGDFAIWMFIFAELTVFALLFAVYSVTRAGHLQEFTAAQRLLDRRFGLGNTLLLVSSGYAVARGQRAMAAGRARVCSVWLGGALLLGAGFVVLKLVEFHTDAARGVTLDASLFDMFYLALTFFHFMHVLLGMAMLAVVSVKAWRGAYGAGESVGVETAGAYWHMVDLLWLILFYLFYVLH